MTTLQLISPEDFDVRDYEIAKNAAEILLAAYPNVVWFTNHTKGIIEIRIGAPTGPWKFTLSSRAESAWAMRRSILMAGGELLARFRLNGRKALAEQTPDMKRDLRGSLVPSL